MRTPGLYRFSPREDPRSLQAIVLAGGLDKYAKPSGAALLRRTPIAARSPSTSSGSSGDLDRDLALQSGDVVFIPESFF